MSSQFFVSIFNGFIGQFTNSIKAIELDDSDVFTLNLLGQTALQIQQLDIAQMAFEKVNDYTVSIVYDGTETMKP